MGNFGAKRAPAGSVKVFADINISTHVVAELVARGHDIARVDHFLDPTATDEAFTD